MRSVSAVITEILYKHQFWWGTWLVLAVVIYLARRRSPAPFPKVGKFFAKHKADIAKTIDIFVVCVVLLWSYLLLYVVRKDFCVLSESEPIRTMSLRLDWMFLFSLLIIWSGISGFSVGFLSIFQSNLTKVKRTILLTVCLLPIVFTAVFAILQMSGDTKESTWMIVQLCIYCSAGSWIINMPAVLVGKDFFKFSGDILQKVRLMFGHRMV